MKKFLSYIFITITLPLFSQIGIGNQAPEGALDLNNSKGNTLGMVLPRVDVVDTIKLGNNFYPSVTLPTDPFQVITVQETDDEGVTTTDYFQVPTQEAPEGTLVYDLSNHCVRFKKSDQLGDWTGCIVDKPTVEDDINYLLYGGSSFKMKKASAGYTFSVAIGVDGSVYSAGYGNAYRTGKGSTSNSTWSVILNQPAVHVDAGFYHGLALLEDGSVWAWGRNSYGRTGLGTTSGYARTPQKVTLPEGIGNVIKVEAGYYNSLLLTDTGRVFVCGRNTYGLLANGANNGTYVSIFTEIIFPAKIKEISLAARAAGAVDENGHIYTWGYNESGRTGVGSTSGYTTTPRDITPSGITFSKIAIGIGNGIALTTDNKLYIWGLRYAIGTTGTDSSPALYTPPVTFDSDEVITHIATAGDRSGPYAGSCIMIATNKTIYGAGYNNSYYTSSGKLGILNDSGNALTGYNNPLQEIQGHSIYSGSVYTGISIGTEHTLITTGENTELSANSYTAYASGGRSGNRQYLYGKTGNRRFFMTVTQ